jgi:hypothetical protein
MLMRPLLLLILAGLSIATPAVADAPKNSLPDVSAAASAPAEPQPAEATEPEVRVPRESSAGFEPRAAHGEY